MNVYDFDGTIFDGDSSIRFYLFALKTNPSLIRFIPKQAAGFILYGAKRIRKTELKEYFFSFLSGIDVEKSVSRFWVLNQKRIHKWYLDQQQEDDIVISASPEFLLRPICRRLGILNLIASRVDPRTGSFQSENCRGEEKVRRLAAEYHITHVDKFYTDSYADLPLTQIADQTYLVKKGKITLLEAPEAVRVDTHNEKSASIDHSLR